ncbi:MAG: sporulation protein [Saprospiraceae bacterium]|nr:sporulation protein [Saprospiraceae bacterium]
MIRRFKHLLGIEGAKVNVFLNEDTDISNGHIEGRIELVSMTPVTIDSLELILEERYKRGRRRKKLIDKYRLAEKNIPLKIELLPEVPVEIPFELSFEKISAPIDEFANRNTLTHIVAWTAKKIKNVESSYLLTVEAMVKGTRLNPFDTLEVLKE